jgi:stage IV sporulation protein FB
MAQRCGLHVPYVIVHSFGAETQINNPDFTNCLQNFKIALAGPVGSLILFGLGLFLKYIFHSTWTMYFIYTNLFLGVFNLLPIFPLDGGRILYSLLGMKFGALKAIRIAVWTSLVLCGLGMLYGLFVGFWWLTIVLAVIIYTGIQEKKVIESFVK